MYTVRMMCVSDCAKMERFGLVFFVQSFQRFARRCRDCSLEMAVFLLPGSVLTPSTLLFCFIF